MTKKKFWIIVCALVIVIGIAAGFLFQKRKTSELLYREIPATRSDLAINILSTGVVSPENRLEIKPPVAGRIEKVLVVEGQKVRKGQVIAWISSTERAALLDAARAKGPAEVKHWQELYNPTPVMAPINGTIIQKNVESGQTFTGTDAVLVMSDRLTVKAQVDETDIAQVTLKQKATVTLDAYPGQDIPATVDQVAFDAKTVNNVTTYTVDVLPDQTPEFMRSGMTANVIFKIASKAQVVTVPNDALKVKDGHYSILVKNSDNGKPLEKEVSVGLSDGKKTEIADGINEGEIILGPLIKTGKKSAGSNPFMPMGGAKRGGK